MKIHYNLRKGASPKNKAPKVTDCDNENMVDWRDSSNFDDIELNSESFKIHFNFNKTLFVN